MKKAEVLNKFWQNDIHPSKLIQKKDGSFEIRHLYFYRHGMTTEKLVDRVLLVFPRADILESYDNFQPWPRDSYFMVRFRVPE